MATKTIQEARDLDEILEDGRLVRVLARGRGALWGSFDGGMRGRTAAAGATLRVRKFSDQAGGARIIHTQEVGRWGRLLVVPGASSMDAELRGMELISHAICDAISRWRAQTTM